MSDIDHAFLAALRELGVHEDLLSERERNALDQQGFVILEGLIDGGVADRMRDEMDRLFESQGIAAGGKGDCDMMENYSAAFDACLIHPRFLAAIAHVLRAPFVSSGVHARPNVPGSGAQALHPDWSAGHLPAAINGTCNSIWMLDAFTVENGATRVIPGSHRQRLPITECIHDVALPHPQQVHLCGTKGDVAVFNGHLWHSACLNRSRSPRPNLTSFWRRRSARGGWTAPELSAEAMARLPAPARFLQVDRSLVAQGRDANCR